MEKSCLALVLRPSAGTAPAEAAKISLATGRMLHSGIFGSNAHAAHVDFRLLRPPLILRYVDLGSIGSASHLETEGDVSNALQRAARGTGMEPVDDPFGEVALADRLAEVRALGAR